MKTDTATAQTAQHTPGPWIASGPQILQGGFLKEWKLEIAILPSRMDPRPKLDAAAKNHSERNANARLIALAPDMLNLLKDAAFQLERLSGESLEIYARTFAALASTAIDKATA